MAVVAGRVTDELECLQIWHDSMEHPFPTRSQRYHIRTLTDQGRISAEALCGHVPQRILVEGKGNISAKRELISEQKRLLMSFDEAEADVRGKRPVVLFPTISLFQTYVGLYCVFHFSLK